MEEHCYLWSSTWLSWADAEQFCKEVDGHLASVTNEKIHNYIQAKVVWQNDKTFFWVGGTDQEQEGKWKWTDGSDWDFTQWATFPAKQPNNQLNQDCLQIYNFKGARDGWNDEDCRKKRSFVCSQRVGQDDALTQGDSVTNNNTNSTIPELVVLAVVLPSGIIVLAIVLLIIGYAAYKSSKKKEEDMDVDKNTVYGVYEFGEYNEREYSRNEIVDQNFYYE